MFKINNKGARTTPLALDIFHTCSTVSIINFEHVIAGWVCIIAPKIYI